ncbi:MAG: lysylphosphatidylglycerol synthase transmembrane domain-containing protein [Flavobacteriaceae bacterium]
MNQTTQSPVPPARGGPWRRIPVQSILLVLLSVALIAALPFVPWREFWSALIGCDPLWLSLAVLATLALYPLWTWQWQLLALPYQRIEFARMLVIVSISAAAKAALSGIGGTVSALALLTNRAGLPPLAAGSFLALDQLFVGLSKLAILAVALAIAPIPPEALAAGGALAALIVLLLLALTTLAHPPRLVRRAAAAERGMLARLTRFLLKISSSLDAMRDIRLAVLALVLALAKKALEVAGAIAVQIACGIEPSLAAAILAIAAVSVTTTLPVVPGNIGTYPLTVYLVYEAAGIPTAQGLAAGLLQHACVIVPALLAGYFIPMLVPRRKAGPR